MIDPLKRAQQQLHDKHFSLFLQSFNWLEQSCKNLSKKYLISKSSKHGMS